MVNKCIHYLRDETPLEDQHHKNNNICSKRHFYQMGRVMLIICFPLLWNWSRFVMVQRREGKHICDIAFLKLFCKCQLLEKCTKPHEVIVSVIICLCKTNWVVTKSPQVDLSGELKIMDHFNPRSHAQGNVV